jgi:hypothetical protein
MNAPVLTGKCSLARCEAESVAAFRCLVVGGYRWIELCSDHWKSHDLGELSEAELKNFRNPENVITT